MATKLLYIATGTAKRLLLLCSYYAIAKCSYMAWCIGVAVNVCNMLQLYHKHEYSMSDMYTQSPRAASPIAKDEGVHIRQTTNTHGIGNCYV